jgi:glycosyltransferase involved in cell wall biosynthesis
MAERLGVADRLELPGTIPYERLPGVYRDTHVFVLASAARGTWREQFGFAVVEAMACGLPVLAGHSGSLDEVVGDPEQLVTPHDPVELAGALERLARDPALRRSRGEANRERALDRFDRRKVAQRIKGFYERVLEAPARSNAASSSPPSALQS